jgi:hypothetical protein
MLILLLALNNKHFDVDILKASFLLDLYLTACPPLLSLGLGIAFIYASFGYHIDTNKF